VPNRLLDSPAPERTLTPRLGQTAQRHLRIRRQHAQHAVQVAIIESVSRLSQVFKVRENLLSARHIARGALKINPVRPQINIDIQAVFEHMQVFVPRAKQCLDVRGDLDALLHSVTL